MDMEIYLTPVLALEVVSLFSQLRKALSSTVCTFITTVVTRYVSLGGYCKEYAKHKRPVGVMLDDTWFLKFVFPLFIFGPGHSQTSTG